MLDWIPTKRGPTPDLESASPALLRRRALAAVIDLVICYVIVETAILAVVMVVFLDFFLAYPGEAFLLSVVGLVPVYLLYTFLFEWKVARTPGKKRMGLVVAENDGSALSVRTAAIRNGLRYVDWLPVGYLLGWAVAHRSADGRRLGDRLAETVVVRPETEATSLYTDERTFDRDESAFEPGDRTFDSDGQAFDTDGRDFDADDRTVDTDGEDSSSERPLVDRGERDQ